MGMEAAKDHLKKHKSRRRYGEGAVVVRENTHGQKRIYINFRAGGKRHWESKSPDGRPFRTEREARDRLRDVLGLAEKGVKYTKPARLTFEEFLPRFWDKCQERNLKPATLEEYRSHVKCYLLPQFRFHKLTAITEEDISHWYVGLRAKRSPRGGTLSSKTLHNILVCLGRIMEVARKGKHIQVNPVRGIERPKQDKAAKGVYLSPEEARRLLEAARETGRLHKASGQLPKGFPDDFYRTLIALALNTGLRVGELTGLKWRDLRDGALYVERAVYWNPRRFADGRPRWTLQTPKSDYSTRPIPLAADVLTMLEAHRKARLVASVDGDEFMFPGPDGAPLNPKNLLRFAFRPTLKRAALPETMRFHDLRHTFVGLEILGGTSLAVLQQRVGHASISTTIGVYGGIHPELQQDAAERTAAMIFGRATHHHLSPEEKRRVLNRAKQDRKTVAQVPRKTEQTVRGRK